MWYIHTNVCLSSQSFRTLMTLSALPICCSALSNGCEKKKLKSKRLLHAAPVCVRVFDYTYVVCVSVFIYFIYRARICLSLRFDFLGGFFADVRFCFLRSAKKFKKKLSFPFLLFCLLLPLQASLNLM